jgi:hypothetical protein
MIVSASPGFNSRPMQYLFAVVDVFVVVVVVVVKDLEHNTSFLVNASACDTAWRCTGRND